MTFVPFVAGWIDVVYQHGEIIGFCPRHNTNFLSQLKFQIASTELQGK